jgi:IstB-like ATP binding protein
MMRWGGDASSDVLRRCARCSRCGRKGASLTAPSWEGLDTGFAPFPVERM